MKTKTTLSLTFDCETEILSVSTTKKDPRPIITIRARVIPAGTTEPEIVAVNGKLQVGKKGDLSPSLLVEAERMAKRVLSAIGCTHTQLKFPSTNNRENVKKLTTAIEESIKRRLPGKDE